MMNLTDKSIISPIILLTVLFLLQSCGGNNTVSSEGEEVELKYAENLSLKEFDGYTIAEIRNPWDTTKLLQKYVLLEEGVDVPEGFTPAQTVRVPLKKSIVYSSVHNGLINELGAPDAISGVCDAEYIYEPSIKSRIENGDIADCGNSMSPNIEKIIKVSPGAILLSPFENSGGHGKLSQAGIPIIECADYMETSPLARSEWMKFYGRLYGKKNEADSMFADTERKYLQLKEIGTSLSTHPKVLIDRIYGQSWNLPAGKSTMGIMIEDAGGINPFGDVKVSGSLQLSPEKVLYEAQDVDIWLIRFAYTPLTLKSLGEDNKLYTQFKAYKEGRVYGSDSSKTRIFEDVAFHPQWLLGNLIALFHPELSLPTEEKTYFEKIEP